MIEEYSSAIKQALPSAKPVPLDDQAIAHESVLIKDLLRQKNAVLVAHYYTDGAIQKVAEDSGGFVGDSLAMAEFGAQHKAQTLVVAGVRFMGETAKILSPEKRVLVPELKAECSLDIGCPADEFSAFCDAHPERTVVVYANTSAAVKARADWVVTSSCAIEIIEHLHEKGEKIIWASDRHLGAYIEKNTGADMLLWQGACIIHDEFKTDALLKLKQAYPQAAVLVHPESPASVVALADVVGSTSQLLAASKRLDAKTMIVGTEEGIFYQMQKARPEVQFIAAPTAGHSAECQMCAVCPWMKMNTLSNVRMALEQAPYEISVPETIRQQAVVSLSRMLEFSAQHLK